MNNQKFKEKFKLLLEKTIFPSDIKDEERSRDWNVSFQNWRID